MGSFRNTAWNHEKRQTLITHSMRPGVFIDQPPPSLWGERITERCRLSVRLSHVDPGSLRKVQKRVLKNVIASFLCYILSTLKISVKSHTEREREREREHHIISFIIGITNHVQLSSLSLQELRCRRHRKKRVSRHGLVTHFQPTAQHENYSSSAWTAEMYQFQYRIKFSGQKLNTEMRLSTYRRISTSLL